MILIVTVTTIIAGFFVYSTLVPWLVSRLRDRDIAPDTPQPFGYRTAWLAIDTDRTGEVVEALGVSDLQCVNWRTGIATIYDEELADDYVFISPPVDGTTYVVGLALPHPVGARFVDKCLPLLHRLSEQFGGVAYFFTYPVIELYAWARFSDGQLKRAFAWGDEGAIWNRGAITDVERSMGLDVFELRRANAPGGAKGRQMRRKELDGGFAYPTEEHVLHVAAEWGLDPTKLDLVSEDVGLGYVAQVPGGWAQRRNKNSPNPDKTPTERRAELRPVR